MKPNEKERIKSFYEGKSADEKSLVAQLFADDKNESDLKELSQQHWKDASNAPVKLDHVLRQIHHQILPGNKASRSSRILTFYSRVAAVLLLPILLSGIYFAYNYYNVHQSVAQIHAPMGSRIHFSLPDGSVGYLNGGSTLSYHSDFNKNRKIELDGEAYFNVQKDQSHPFWVHTYLASIKVTGTQFDVRAYEQDNELTTTLVEGSVEVFNKSSKLKTTLKPGEQNRIEKLSGEMTTQTVNTQLYTSWKEDILRIDNTPFAEVVKLMERWYGVNIQLDPSLKHSQTYTMTLKTESLREMLELLKITTPFNYKIDGNKVFISDETNSSLTR